MPDVYQVSDRKREHSPAPTRKDCGLPARKFVFCSFNNNHKYTLEVFTTWMNILRRVPNSVLWLLADNPGPGKPAKQAKAQGIDPKRLVFAERTMPADYLARYLVADLFLDTFPFNAGTTANDALWMGLPVLTMSGRSFASRMAGALLTAADLPELITHDLQTYEDKAVALAADAKARKTMRQKLALAKAARCSIRCALPVIWNSNTSRSSVNCKTRLSTSISAHNLNRQNWESRHSPTQSSLLFRRQKHCKPGRYTRRYPALPPVA